MKKAIVDIINQLTEHSRYYREIISQYGVNSLPNQMLCDEAIIKRKYDILDDRISPTEAEALYTHNISFDKFKENIEILWSYNDMQKVEKVLSTKRKKWYSVSYADRFCRNHIPGRGKNPFRILDDIYISPHKNFISFSNKLSNKADAEKYLYYMNVFQPVWVSFDDEFFLNLNNYIFENGLVYPKSIRYAEIKCSFMSPLFNWTNLPFICAYILYDPVVTELAYSCPHGQFHILDELVYIEYLESNNKINSYVTSLCNRVFPIIRYQTPLPHCINNFHCNCGVSGNVFEKKETNY